MLEEYSVTWHCMGCGEDFEKKPREVTYDEDYLNRAKCEKCGGMMKKTRITFAIVEEG